MRTMTEHTTQGRLLEGFDPKRIRHLGQEEQEQDWSQIFNSYQNDFILEAELEGFEKISEKTCGVAYLDNIRILIPVELSGYATYKEFREYAGLRISFIVKEFDQDKGVVIGSRKEALAKKAEITRRKLKEGDVILSVVRRILAKEAILDIGGIEVSLPVMEIRHGWIQSIQQELSVGDVIEVKVLAVTDTGVTVSAKALQQDPWESDVIDRFKVGNEYMGRVTGTADFGNFINLAQGVDAIAPHLKFEHVKMNDRVLVRIRHIDRKERRIVSRIVKVGT